MKAVLSQTVFANAAHLHGLGVRGKDAQKMLQKRPGMRLIADLDSNGWPQTGRNRALATIRKGFATMLCGDQHLATLIHHGVNEFGDAGVSFVSPSILNHYGRAWSPLGEPERAIEGGLPMRGEYRDGFGNKMTMLAYVNPDAERLLATTDDGEQWGPAAEGYGLVFFDKHARTMRYEVWPRMVDVKAGAQPYEGWPVTRTQQDQYGRAARAWLPTVVVGGAEHPVTGRRRGDRRRGLHAADPRPAVHAQGVQARHLHGARQRTAGADQDALRAGGDARAERGARARLLIARPKLGIDAAPASPHA